MADKKYYWLKLQKNFFKRHDVKIIRAMPNGDLYALIYLQLMLESIDHEGALRFSESLPYKDEMLSAVLEIDVKDYKKTKKCLTDLELLQVLEDETILMTKVPEMIGCESSSAERVRRHREKKKDSDEPPAQEGTQADDIPAPAAESVPAADDFPTSSGNVTSNADVTPSNEPVTQSKRESPEKKIDPETDKDPPPVSVLINQAIEHWRSHSCLPRCRYHSMNLPKVADVREKFDAFTLEEITKAIDYLAKYWKEVPAKFRPGAFQNFMTRSLDSWVEDAKPWERYQREEKKKEPVREDRIPYKAPVSNPDEPEPSEVEAAQAFEVIKTLTAGKKVPDSKQTVDYGQRKQVLDAQAETLRAEATG